MLRFSLRAVLLSLAVLALSVTALAQNAAWQQAQTLVNQQRWTEASAAFAAIEQNSPGKTDALLYRARALVQLDQLKDAEPALESFIATHPASAEGWRELGYVRFCLRKPTGSLDAYEQAAKLSLVTPADLTISAQDYLLMMDTLSAAQALEQARKLDPSYLEAIYQLGRVRYRQGRMDDAIACFQQVLQADPSRLKAQENLGLSLEHSGQMDAAIAAFQAAVALDSGSAKHDEHSYLYLGALLVKIGRSQYAVPVLQRGIALNPQSAKLHAALGRAYFNLKQVAGAQAELEQAVRLDPKDGASHYALGRLYTSQGNRELAATQFEAAKAQFEVEKSKSATVGMGRDMQLTPE
jgi:tetratricopeptide (TPR) repeat protein